MFLIQVNFFCRRDKEIFLSEFIFVVLRTYFLNQENISQYVLRLLQCTWVCHLDWSILYFTASSYGCHAWGRGRLLSLEHHNGWTNFSHWQIVHSTGWTNVNLLYIPDGIEIVYLEGLTLCCLEINQSKQPCICIVMHDFHGLKTATFHRIADIACF